MSEINFFYHIQQLKPLYWAHLWIYTYMCVHPRIYYRKTFQTWFFSWRRYDLVIYQIYMHEKVVFYLIQLQKPPYEPPTSKNVHISCRLRVTIGRPCSAALGLSIESWLSPKPHIYYFSNLIFFMKVIWYGRVECIYEWNKFFLSYSTTKTPILGPLMNLHLYVCSPEDLL